MRARRIVTEKTTGFEKNRCFIVVIGVMVLDICCDKVMLLNYGLLKTARLFFFSAKADVVAAVCLPCGCVGGGTKRKRGDNSAYFPRGIGKHPIE